LSVFRDPPLPLSAFLRRIRPLAANAPPGIEHAKDPAEGIVARDAVLEIEESPEESFLGSPEQGHVRTILRAAKHRTERNQKKFVKIMPRIILTWIFESSKTGEKLFHGAPKH